jgi:lipoprotein-releasing system permease protein
MEQMRVYETSGPRDPFNRSASRSAEDLVELATASSDAGESGDDKTRYPSAVPPGVESIAAAKSQDEAKQFDEMNEQHTGLILGIAMCSMKRKVGEGKVEDFFLCLPGDDVKLTFPTAGAPPQAVNAQFTVVDFYESKMSEYDSTLAFVPLGELQRLRGMIDPRSGLGAVTSIQIRLKKGADLNQARDTLQARFPAPEFPYNIQTWRDMQGPLLQAVQMETMILNSLLFLIIAVAGFGILATFFMIVVEKTKDIGILKSLGAPSSGIAKIFLAYGLSLGVVGSGVGMVMGLLFVVYINQIADLLGWITGTPVFDPEIYYFSKIPTIIDTFTIVWIVLGAMLIAVLASVLPAMRAARLHPVEALRYE